ncbi:MAG: SDR family oxidoreductase, partial [Proteobacteria bacterium]|nr:SDR family oxidoreductase [Pseudomonadota bacterium]
MTEPSPFPNWVPQVTLGSRILIVGSSGGIGKAVVEMLGDGPECFIGAHHFSASPSQPPSPKQRLVNLKKDLKSEAACTELIDEFIAETGGIDALVVLCGAISNAHFMDISQQQWESDLLLNLSAPFYLSRHALKHMNRGRILLMGTESALHGGGPTSLAYAVAKRGIECLVQALAKEGAKKGNLVNGVRPGYIRSGTHERWKNATEEDLARRAEMVPLKRAGTTQEVAALILFLLSDWAQFLTG